MLRSTLMLPHRHAALPALALATAALFNPAAAQAQRVLPAPDYRLTIGGLGQYRLPDTYTFAGTTLSAKPFPQPALAGSATGNPALGAGFEGSISYSFAVDGPTLGMRVPMFVSFALGASVQGALANASAVFGISFAHDGDFTARVDADAAQPLPLDIFDTRAFHVISGGPIAHAVLGIQGATFNGLVKAFADPYIFVEPAFAAAHPGYTVSVSPGIGNLPLVTSVPEPQTWATLLMGFGLLAAASRRKAKRRVVPGRWRSLGAGLLGATAACAAAAQAPPALMPVQFSLQARTAFLGNAGTATSGTFFASGNLGSTGPSVAVHGEGLSSFTTVENEASAQALWAFQINGPAGVDVPILITGLYSASESNTMGVSGGLAMGQDRFRLSYVLSFRCLLGDESGCDSSRNGFAKDFVLHEKASSNTLTFMQIATGGSLRRRGHPGNGIFNAFIDPLVSIDPAFARASEFTLYVSPGAEGFAAAVPEPHAYALLLGGLTAVAWVARRRRKAAESMATH